MPTPPSMVQKIINRKTEEFMTEICLSKQKREKIPGNMIIINIKK